MLRKNGLGPSERQYVANGHEFAQLAHTYSKLTIDIPIESQLNIRSVHN